MNTGRTIFAQVLDGIDRTEFERCAARYPLERRVRAFSAYDHFAAMVFAQLTYRQSLRDIEACLRARGERLYHCGIRGRVSRSNLAYANTHRDWRVFAAVAEVLMRRAHRLCHAERSPTAEPDIFAFDASLIDLSMALCPWAYRQQYQAAIRLNVLLDVRADLPEFVNLSEGNTHEVRCLDELPLRPGAIYVMDRGYLDFRRLYRFQQYRAFFVIRGKARLRFHVLRSTKIDRQLGLRCDQTVRLTGAARTYPEPLRRIRYFDAVSARSFVFLTNNFELEAATIAELYRKRWHVELFFRWIKQHLRLRWFYAYSPNGVRVQIWSAICAHLLVAIARERYRLSASLYEILQVVSIGIWEKAPLPELFAKPAVHDNQTDFCDLLIINDP